MEFSVAWVGDKQGLLLTSSAVRHHKDLVMEKLSVLSPIGAEAVEQKNLAKRLDTLNGKVVAEVWNEDFKGDIMFPIYREMLKERFPDVKIVPYTDIPYASLKGTPSYQREVLGSIITALREKGADAVITGNGG
jgi:hypothetical protein